MEETSFRRSCACPTPHSADADHLLLRVPGVLLESGRGASLHPIHSVRRYPVSARSACSWTDAGDPDRSGGVCFTKGKTGMRSGDNVHDAGTDRRVEPGAQSALSSAPDTSRGHSAASTE